MWQLKGLHECGPPCRLRKDPLDPIDSGTKVQILFNRLTDPEFVKREEEAKKKQVRRDNGPWKQESIVTHNQVVSDYQHNLPLIGH